MNAVLDRLSVGDSVELKSDQKSECLCPASEKGGVECVKKAKLATDHLRIMYL